MVGTLGARAPASGDPDIRALIDLVRDARRCKAALVELDRRKSAAEAAETALAEATARARAEAEARDRALAAREAEVRVAADRQAAAAGALERDRRALEDRIAAFEGDAARRADALIGRESDLAERTAELERALQSFRRG